MRITVLVLNVWLGGKIFDPLIDFLRQEDADVVLLQEVFDSPDTMLEPRFRTVQAMQQALQYPAHDFDRCFTQQFDFGTVERGNAVLSKLPILDRQSHVLGGTDGVFEDIPVNFGKFRHNLQQVVLDAGGTPLTVFNFQGLWDLDGERDSPERLAMSQAIVAAVHGQSKVVLAGDTNAKRNTNTIRNIEAELTNVFQDELMTSFNLRRKDLENYPGYASAVVDMAFVSRDITVLEHSCPDVDVSDHMPLRFTIEV